MRYQRVFINKIAYELPKEKVATSFLEEQLTDVYQELGIPLGQVEALTKIHQRRYWPVDHQLSDHAALAAKKAIKESGINSKKIQVLIYAGVGRAQLEPATACAVAHQLAIASDASVYDVSNACLGVLNGIIQIANAIELGQIHAGLVVSAESCREIIDTMVAEMKIQRNIEHFALSLATLTGGSGAVAVLLSDNALDSSHQLLGAVARQKSQWHQLCRWGSKTGILGNACNIMHTDSVSVLKYGVELGVETYKDFLQELLWQDSFPDKYICHQVGEANQLAIRRALNIPKERDFTTYETLANTGTVALPMTAAIADQVGFLKTGDKVAFLGIGSGLNCMMLGIKW
ncbi:3-oxoacyl-ACP synthase [Legionella brunensis]|uniref:3-oxoacyl-ACP synthase n=2 Tax=Legionella brunensis TaxID=29422 RepID=A0A0W0SL20_9GAMM|nr:3-oxoacyl-ACP synthase [Legionella brunensis]